MVNLLNKRFNKNRLFFCSHFDQVKILLPQKMYSNIKELSCENAFLQRDHISKSLLRPVGLCKPLTRVAKCTPPILILSKQTTRATPDKGKLAPIGGTSRLLAKPILNLLPKSLGGTLSVFDEQKKSAKSSFLYKNKKVLHAKMHFRTSKKCLKKVTFLPFETPTLLFLPKIGAVLLYSSSFSIINFF